MSSSIFKHSYPGLTVSISSMAKELELIGYRYSIITLVFFTTYVVFQFPSTIIIKKVGPKYFLPLITFLWGIIMLSMGFVKDWKVMAGMRVILGIFEAGFFPGSVYLLRYMISIFACSTRLTMVAPGTFDMRYRSDIPSSI